MRIRAINKFDRHFVLESKTAIKLKCKLQNARFAFRPKSKVLHMNKKNEIIRRRNKFERRNDQFKKELTKTAKD